MPRMFLSSWKNDSYIALHDDDFVYSSFFFFNFFDKGCHILRLNVICEQRHVFKLTIYKFQGKYIWRLVGFTESDARRTQRAALRKKIVSNIEAWCFFVGVIIINQTFTKKVYKQ